MISGHFSCQTSRDHAPISQLFPLRGSAEATAARKNCLLKGKNFKQVRSWLSVNGGMSSARSESKDKTFLPLWMALSAVFCSSFKVKMFSSSSCSGALMSSSQQLPPVFVTTNRKLIGYRMKCSYRWKMLSVEDWQDGWWVEISCRARLNQRKSDLRTALVSIWEARGGKKNPLVSNQ